MSGRKRVNQAGGFDAVHRAHHARLRYVAIVGRLRQGATRDEVCAEFDVSLNVIFNARRALGVPSNRGAPGRPRPYLRAKGPSPRVVERLALVAEGVPWIEVARRCGVSRQCVADDVRRWPDELHAMAMARAQGNQGEQA